MSFLRDTIIEEVAPRIHASDPAYSPPYWSDCTEDMKRWYRDQAAGALDAMLDTLSAYADEWDDLARREPGLLNASNQERLIAVLRSVEEGTG